MAVDPLIGQELGGYRITGFVGRGGMGSVYRARDETLRRDIALKLLQLDALDQIEALQKQVDAFAQRSGELPASWQMLVAASALPAIPVDPGGTPYELTESGRVVLSVRSTLFPLPLEPGPRTGAP